MSSTRTVPAFQRGYNLASTSGCVVPSGRMVPDVSLAASDLSAYLPGWAGTGDYVVGGTSASAPFWAGILATANAVRAQAGKAPLASAHQVLYDVVGQTHTSYAAGMYDVRAGENGSCSTCAATAGYDLATGLGTPNVNAVLGYFRDR